MNIRPLKQFRRKSCTALALLIAAAGTFSQPALAAPLVSIADTVDIFFRGELKGQYNSNIFSNGANKRDDFIFTFSPGLEVSAGRTENANITLIFREDFVRYNRSSSLNADLANLFIDGFYKTGPATLSSGFSFYQTQTPTGDINVVNNLVRRNIYRAYGELEYDISEKIVGDIGFSWDRTDFQSFQTVYSNRDVYSAPVNIFYRVTPKLNVGLGYRYRYTDVDTSTGPVPAIASDYQDHFYNLALRGDIMPKVYATMNVGGTTRVGNATNMKNDTTFAIDSSLRWDMTPKSELAATFSRDFNTSASGTTITRTGGTLSASYRVTQFIQSSAFFGYNVNDYTGAPRTDYTTNVGGSLNYTPNAYLRFGAGYTYQNNDSDVSPYQSHIISLSASLRY